ncbi:MAG: tripartite tricarboxylate transporter TctB family protein [Candidatus Accumulibacter sp.]|nr:tripartite tricarboxylate transporter TctB family protein [Accumulibacter sp.]
MERIVRNPKELWIGIIYVFIGSVAIYLCQDLDMGRAGKMGAAYFPTILSVLLIVVGVISLVRSFVVTGLPIERFAIRGMALITLSIVLFGVLARGAGLAVALPVLVIVSALASVKFRWSSSLLMSVGITIFCVVVFLKGLGIPLPVLGRWFGV